MDVRENRVSRAEGRSSAMGSVLAARIPSHNYGFERCSSKNRSGPRDLKETSPQRVYPSDRTEQKVLEGRAPKTAAGVRTKRSSHTADRIVPIEPECWTTLDYQGLLGSKLMTGLEGRSSQIRSAKPKNLDGNVEKHVGKASPSGGELRLCCLLCGNTQRIGINQWSNAPNANLN
ncbi:hypothetical protein BDN70DRAFT_899827 [Pholiota conissans]|uniref:Uncharacterized protein n=1 Tax=Pholiota conissans TaxID=109636 RepID=A0A9P5YSY4_9AGAR|nr:hypothetical protein BDN70DRAFT_899827 [Pholiota conissans]